LFHYQRTQFFFLKKFTPPIVVRLHSVERRLRGGGRAQPRPCRAAECLPAARLGLTSLTTSEGMSTRCPARCLSRRAPPPSPALGVSATLARVACLYPAAAGLQSLRPQPTACSARACDAQARGGIAEHAGARRGRCSDPQRWLFAAVFAAFVPSYRSSSPI